MEMEDSDILRDPENPDEAGRQRPDLSMKVPYDHMPQPRRCVVEVTIGNTIEGTKSGKLKCTIGQRVQQGRIAARKFVTKQNKYRTLANNRGVDLKIISIETGGFMHEESVRFVKKLASVAAKNRPDVEYYDMKRYMFTKISVALNSAIGTVINRRINAASGHSAPTIEDHRRQTDEILQSIARAQ